VTPSRGCLDERAVEQLLTGRAGSADPDLQRALTLLRSVGTGPAPQPTAALAQLLDAGFKPEVVPLRRRAPRRTWAARVGAGLTATAASLLVAGTAQALPPALQDGLAELVSAVTPFELPRSTDPEPAPVDQTDPVAPPAPSSPAATPTSAGPTRDDDTYEPGEDRTAAEQQDRERQRSAEEAAEESERAAEEAADDAEDAADEAEEDAADEAEEDAAREREDAAREAARASEEAAEEVSEPAERGGEPEPEDTEDDD
jgi:type IV secretory pathway VirB10-like protein